MECYLARAIYGARLFVAFSILGRIVWNATKELGVVLPTQGNFQYPWTDRVECYRRTNNGDIKSSYFQYPRTDRVECYASVPPPDVVL